MRDKTSNISNRLKKAKALFLALLVVLVLVSSVYPVAGGVSASSNDWPVIAKDKFETVKAGVFNFSKFIGGSFSNYGRDTMKTVESFGASLSDQMNSLGTDLKSGAKKIETVSEFLGRQLGGYVNNIISLGDVAGHRVGLAVTDLGQGIAAIAGGAPKFVFGTQVVGHVLGGYLDTVASLGGAFGAGLETISRGAIRGIAVLPRQVGEIGQGVGSLVSNSISKLAEAPGQIVAFSFKLSENLKETASGLQSRVASYFEEEPAEAPIAERPLPPTGGTPTANVGATQQSIVVGPEPPAPASGSVSSGGKVIVEKRVEIKTETKEQPVTLAQILKLLKSASSVGLGNNIILDTASGTATFKGLRIAGLLDLTGAEIRGLEIKQNIINNYSSTSTANPTSPPPINNVYNTFVSQSPTNWQPVVGTVGGVTTDFSVGRDLTVSQNATVASTLTVGTGATGRLVINGNGSITGTLAVTGATTLTGALTANGNSTLGDTSADLLTINAVTSSTAPMSIMASSSGAMLYIKNTASVSSTDPHPAIRIAGSVANKNLDLFVDENGNAKIRTTNGGGGDIYMHPDGGNVYLQTNLIVGSGGNATIQATGRANFSYDPVVGAPSLWLSTSSTYPTYRTYFAINPAETVSFDRFIHISHGNSDRFVLGYDGDLLLNTSSTYSGNLFTLRKGDSSRFYVDNSGNVYASGTLSAAAMSVAGHLLPSSDNLYDVGSSSTQWRYGNFQGGLLVADGTNTSTLANASLIVAQGSTANLGKFYVDSSGNVSATGALTIFGNTTLGDSSGDTITINGRLSTLNISDGSTTSSLAKNSFYIAADASNAVGKFYVDSSGNVSASGTLVAYGDVGIGTATPGSKLHVFSSTADVRLAVDAPAANYAGLQFQSAGVSKGGIYYRANDADRQQFWVGETEKVSILGTGNVGIGTVSPANKLTISGGNLSVTNSSVTSTLGANFFAIATSTTNMQGLFYIDSSGNVSASGTLGTFGAITSGGHLYPRTDNLYDIGASSTQWRYGNFQGGLLVADGTNTSTLSNTTLTLTGGSITSSGSSGLSFRGPSGNPELYVYDNYIYVVDNSMIVGTTANPANKLSIVGNVSIGTNYNVTAPSNGLIVEGNVGIGTVSPANKLTISGGNLSVTNSSVSSTLGANFFAIATSTTNMQGLFYVDSSGNISASGSNVKIANVQYTFPGSQGAASTYLKNDGAGALSWATVSAGSTNDWGRFSSTYGTLALMTSSTYPIWFDGAVYASSTLTISTSGNNVSSTIIDGSSIAVGKGAGYGGGVFKVASGTGSISTSGTLNLGGTKEPLGSVTRPTHAGSISGGDTALTSPRSVFVSGNNAYIASSGSGALEIVDVTNPAAPAHKGKLLDGGGSAPYLSGAQSVFVSGNYAYVVSTGSDALEIIDISNPAVPTHKGSVINGAGGALLTDPNSVYVSGNYAYIASHGSNALEIIDVSNPSNPVHKGSLADGVGGAKLTTPSSVYVSGNYAYLGTDNDSGSLEIVDISNPSAPVHKGSLSHGTGGANLYIPETVFVSGNYAYVGVYDALEIVDISNPTAPTHKGKLVGDTSVFSYIASVFVSGDYAYAASNGNNKVQIIDISDPTNPVIKGTIANGDGGAALAVPRSVFVAGNYAYVVSDSHALEVIDVSGAVISNAQVGNLLVDTLQVSNLTQFNQGLLVRDGLSVGGNAQLFGDVSIGGGAATTSAAVASSSLSVWGTVNIGAGATSTGRDQAQLVITASSTTANPLMIRSSLGQTSNLFALQNNAGKLLSFFDNNASLRLGGGTTTSTFASSTLFLGTTSGFNAGKFSVDSSGNVSASGSLLTFGNVTSTGNLYALSGTASTSILNGSSLTLGQGTNYNSGMFNVDSNGNVSASGTARVGAGSVSNVGYGFVGTSNSGMYQIEPGIVGISQGGSISAGFYSSSIRTPQINSVGQSVALFIKGLYTDGAGAIGVDIGSSNSFSTAGTKLVRIVNATTEKAFFDLNGELSIGGGTATSTLSSSTLKLGATSSAALGKFYVDPSGNTSASGSLLTYGNVTSTGILYGNNGLIVASGSAGKFSVDSSGNTSTSGTLKTNGQLTIYGNALLDQSNKLYLYNTSSYLDYTGIYGIATVGFNISNIGTGGVLFSTGATPIERMRIGLNGNVNIGSVLAYTDVIPDKLTISNGNLRIGNGSVSSTLSANFLAIATSTTNRVGLFYVDSSGNTAASGTLRVYGGASAGGLLISATNSTTTLTSYVADGVGAGAFVLNSANTITSTTVGTNLDRVLLSIQNNGTNKFVVSGGGNVYATAGFNANSTQYGIGDVAEYVNLTPGESVEPGDILVVDKTNPNKFKKSTVAYTKEVAGVVSDTGAFVMGAAGTDRAALALAGLVRVKVSIENGPIAVGDYLVSAAKSGYAMRYDTANPQAAGLVGMALEPATEDGRITIMVNKGLLDGAAVTNLNVTQNAAGQIIGTADLNLAGYNILGVKGIASASGLWSINEEGLFVSKDIKADKAQIKQIVVEKDAAANKSTVGEGVIKANQTSVIINNEMVSSTAKIFITFRNNPKAFWWISRQEDGLFEVSLSQSATEDVTFDYWLVGIVSPVIPADAGIQGNTVILNQDDGSSPPPVTPPSEPPASPSLLTGGNEGGVVTPPPPAGGTPSNDGDTPTSPVGATDTVILNQDEGSSPPPAL